MALSKQMLEDLPTWADALHVADPTRWLGELLEESFDLPHEAPEYRANELSPGTIPFETSFSQRAPNTLRLDIEPWPQKLSPEVRRERLTSFVVALAREALSEQAADRFSAAAAPWLESTHPLRFGGFLGASFDANGVSDLRIYFEHTGQASASALCGAVAGTLPIMESVTVSRTKLTHRTYFCFSQGHRLGHLHAFMQQIDLGHRFAELGRAAHPFAGALVVQPGRSVAGVRRDGDAVELKLDLMIQRSRAEEVRRAIDLPGYLVWDAAVGRPAISVVGVRVRNEDPVDLNVYAHPYA